jgi:hypothetical protein
MTTLTFMLAAAAFLVALTGKAPLRDRIQRLERDNELILRRLEYLRARLPGEPEEDADETAAAPTPSREAVPEPAAPAEPERLPLPAYTFDRPVLEPPPTPPVPRGPRRKRDWERWVGTHLLAIGGAVFVLLGTVFFVALAISNGWLTPPRQVAAAEAGAILLGAAALRVRSAEDRARNILGQSLAGAAGGVATLGFVASARIYETPVMPTWLALIGTGLAGLFLVACAVRWRAQLTAALGITTTLAAPLLIGAPASLGTAAFVALALAVADTVVVWRRWPWLAQVGLWTTAPQLAIWFASYRSDFVNGSASAGEALGVAAAAALWWLLVAGPALALEVRGARRLAPVTLLLGASGAVTLIGLWGVAAPEHPHAFAARVMGATLVALHLGVAAVVRRRARHATLLLLALAGAVAALAATTAFGGTGQTVFWAIEWVALYALARRERDVQTLLASAAVGVAAVVRAVTVAPPTVLVVGGHSAASVLLVTVAVAGALLGCAMVDRRRDPGWWVLAGIIAALYAAQAVAVSLVTGTPGDWPVDQVAQMAGTGAMIGVAILTTVALRRVTPAFPRHGAAVALSAVIALKSAIFDVPLGFGTAADAVGIPLIAAGLLVLALVAGPPSRARKVPVNGLNGVSNLHYLLLSLESIGGPVAAGLLMGWGALTVVTPVVLAVGSDAPGWRMATAIASTLLVLSAAAVIERRGGARERWLGAIFAAGLYAAQAIAVTVVSPHAGSEPVDQAAQFAGTGAMLAVIGATTLALRLRVPQFPRAGLALIVTAPLCAKVALIDVTALGRTSTLAALATAAVVAGLLVTALIGGPGRSRGPGGRLASALGHVEQVTPAGPAAALAALVLALFIGPLALAYGSDRLLAAVPLWAGLFAALLLWAVWPGQGERVRAVSAAVLRAGRCRVPATLALAFAALLGFVAALTVTAPHAGVGPAVQRCQVAATIVLIAAWIAATALGRAGVIAPLAGREPALVGWLVALEAICVDMLAFEVKDPSLAPLAVAFVLAATYALRTSGGPVPRLGPGQVPAAAALVVGGVITGGLGALAFGSTNALAAIASLAAGATVLLVTARRIPDTLAWRDGTILAGLVALIWALSIGTVTAVTSNPGSGTIERGAQLALSLAWAVAGIALIAIGFLGRGPVASVVRRTGIPLIGLAVAKVLTYDTARMTTAQRAGLFIGIGVVMFIGAYLYTRLLKTIRPPGDAQPAG